VVAILGILAAVVIPNVIGLMGRGGRQAWETDQEVLQLASSAFYSDTHAGYGNVSMAIGTPAWGQIGENAAHLLPTALAYHDVHELTTNPLYDAPDDTGNPILVWDVASANATDTNIQASAMWMGLLYNAPGEPLAGAGNTSRLGVAPEPFEEGPYIQEIPRSSMGEDNTLWNGGDDTRGGYCWVVGKNGQVYGAYKASDGNWYTGFSGGYP